MIPYNTDAPLYHFPIATLSLIVLNIVLLVITPAELVQPPGETKFAAIELADAGPKDSAPAGASTFRLSLDYGQGLKPWQWFTSMFMHNGFIHLILNLITLWAFGLVVEGKVGSLVFLMLYVGIGAAQAAVAQLLLSFGSEGGSLGANAAILGLLGIAIVWAPRNEFDVLWSFGLRGGSVEIPILMYGFIALGFELLGVVFGPMAISSSILHLLGLVFGLGCGYIWLQRKWVDCEGWDLVSVYHGVEGKYAPDHEASAAVEQEARALIRNSLGSRPETPVPVATTPRPPKPANKIKPANKTKPAITKPTNQATGTSRAKPKSTATQPLNETPANSSQSAATSASDHLQHDIDQLLSTDNYATALKLLNKLRAGGVKIELSQPQLGKLIRDLLVAQEYPQAVSFLTEHIERFEQGKISLQLNLAKVLLHLERPHRAADVLRSIDRASLDEATLATWTKLATHARQQIDSGVIELSEE
jgi:membrane associated rhomboid family serine protease